MPASATPPSVPSKNFICVAVGLPSEIVQATIVPSRRTLTGFFAEPTLAWKPVVRLTARQGVAGQLGVVTGLVAAGTPTSLSVAGAAAGSARASARLANRANGMRLIRGIQHDRRVDSRGLRIFAMRATVPARRPRSAADRLARAPMGAAAGRPGSGE